MADPAPEPNRDQIERDQGEAFLAAIREMREREAKRREQLYRQVATALEAKDKEDAK